MDFVLNFAMFSADFQDFTCVNGSAIQINEASLFEVTTSKSCDNVNGFHNVMFGPVGKAIISRSVFR